MVRPPESQGERGPVERVWTRGVPGEIGFLMPEAPAGLRYEYAVSELLASAGRGLNATLVIRARGAVAEERFVINPTRLAEEIIACGGCGYERLDGSKSQLRFNADGAFRLEDVAYRCAHFLAGCPSTLRVRHWAPAAAGPAPKPDARPQRRCVECGRKGHRKQCCCDEPGNCRVEIVWAHTHDLDAVPPSSTSRKRPNVRYPADTSALGAGSLKKPRADANLLSQSCPCNVLRERIHNARKKLLAAQSALRSLKRAVEEIDEASGRLSNELGNIIGDTQSASQRQQNREKLREQVQLLCDDHNKAKSDVDSLQRAATATVVQPWARTANDKPNEIASTQVVQASVDAVVDCEQNAN